MAEEMTVDVKLFLFVLFFFLILMTKKAGYTATPVTCRWTGAMFEVH